MGRDGKNDIQACPKAFAGLRYLHELIPGLYVIAAGSLLDFALREFEYSVPVGRVEFLHLHPMSFEELLEATEGVGFLSYLKRIQFYMGPLSLEEVALPANGDAGGKFRLLSVPLYAVGQLDRLLDEAEQMAGEAASKSA